MLIHPLVRRESNLARPVRRDPGEEGIRNRERKCEIRKIPVITCTGLLILVKLLITLIITFF